MPSQKDIVGTFGFVAIVSGVESDVGKGIVIRGSSLQSNPEYCCKVRSAGDMGGRWWMLVYQISYAGKASFKRKLGPKQKCKKRRIVMEIKKRTNKYKDKY